MCGPGERSPYSDSLWAGLPGDRIPVEPRFSALVQTGSGAHPALYTIGAGSFPRVKRAGGALTSSTKVQERVELYLYSTSGPSWPVIGWTFLKACVTFAQYNLKLPIATFLNKNSISYICRYAQQSGHHTVHHNPSASLVIGLIPKTKHVCMCRSSLKPH